MDGIGFRPLRNLENQSKSCSHQSPAHGKRENCSKVNSHFGQQNDWGGILKRVEILPLIELFLLNNTFLFYERINPNRILIALSSISYALGFRSHCNLEN